MCYIFVSTKTNKPLKFKIMTISKTFLRKQIQDYKNLIESYNEESRNFPQIASHNAKQVLRMEGKIQAFEALINMR